jgi:hypothetical protein
LDFLKEQGKMFEKESGIHGLDDYGAFDPLKAKAP